MTTHIGGLRPSDGFNQLDGFNLQIPDDQRRVSDDEESQINNEELSQQITDEELSSLMDNIQNMNYDEQREYYMNLLDQGYTLQTLSILFDQEFLYRDGDVILFTKSGGDKETPLTFAIRTRDFSFVKKIFSTIKQSHPELSKAFYVLIAQHYSSDPELRNNPEFDETIIHCIDQLPDSLPGFDIEELLFSYDYEVALTYYISRQKRHCPSLKYLFLYDTPSIREAYAHYLEVFDIRVEDYDPRLLKANGKQVTEVILQIWSEKLVPSFKDSCHRNHRSLIEVPLLLGCQSPEEPGVSIVLEKMSHVDKCLAYGLRLPYHFSKLNTILDGTFSKFFILACSSHENFSDGDDTSISESMAMYLIEDFISASEDASWIKENLNDIFTFACAYRCFRIIHCLAPKITITKQHFDLVLREFSNSNEERQSQIKETILFMLKHTKPSVIKSDLIKLSCELDSLFLWQNSMRDRSLFATIDESNSKSSSLAKIKTPLSYALEKSARNILSEYFSVFGLAQMQKSLPPNWRKTVIKANPKGRWTLEVPLLLGKFHIANTKTISSNVFKQYKTYDHMRHVYGKSPEIDALLNALFGKTELLLAIRCNDFDKIDKLLGINVLIESEKDNSNLENINLEILSAVDAVDGNTVLHEAIIACNIPLVKILLKAKIDANARNKHRDTPLSCACNSQNTADSTTLVKLLLANRADFYEGLYPVIILKSFIYGNRGLLEEFLIPLGFDRVFIDNFINLAKHCNTIDFQEYLKAKVGKNVQQRFPKPLSQNDLLDLSILSLFFPFLELVELGYKKPTPQTMMLCYERIKDLGPEVEETLDSLFDTNRFQLAIELQDYSKIDQLIAEKRFFNIRDAQGNTMLHLLAMMNPIRPDLITHIVRAGIDVHAKNLLGQTALHLLYENKDSEAYSASVIVIRDGGADVFVKDNSGNTPLQLAIMSKNFTIIGALISSFEFDTRSLASAFTELTSEPLDNISPDRILSSFKQALMTLIDTSGQDPDVILSERGTFLEAVFLFGDLEMTRNVIKNMRLETLETHLDILREKYPGKNRGLYNYIFEVDLGSCQLGKVLKPIEEPIPSYSRSREQYFQILRNLCEKLEHEGKREKLKDIIDRLENKKQLRNTSPGREDLEANQLMGWHNIFPAYLFAAMDNLSIETSTDEEIEGFLNNLLNVHNFCPPRWEDEFRELYQQSLYKKEETSLPQSSASLSTNNSIEPSAQVKHSFGDQVFQNLRVLRHYIAENFVKFNGKIEASWGIHEINYVLGELNRDLGLHLSEQTDPLLTHPNFIKYIRPTKELKQKFLSFYTPQKIVTHLAEHFAMMYEQDNNRGQVQSTEPSDLHIADFIEWLETSSTYKLWKPGVYNQRYVLEEISLLSKQKCSPKDMKNFLKSLDIDWNWNADFEDTWPTSADCIRLVRQLSDQTHELIKKYEKQLRNATNSSVQDSAIKNLNKQTDFSAQLMDCIILMDEYRTDDGKEASDYEKASLIPVEFFHKLDLQPLAEVTNLESIDKAQKINFRRNYLSESGGAIQSFINSDTAIFYLLLNLGVLKYVGKQ